MIESLYGNEYLMHIINNLTEEGFTIDENITYRRSTFSYIAKRRKIKAEFVTVQEILIIFARFSMLRDNSIRYFSSDCRCYARRHRLIPYFPLTGGVMCFPTALTFNCDETAIEYSELLRPKVGIGYTELPIIIDLSRNRFWYSKQTSWFGQLALPYARETIQELLR